MYLQCLCETQFHEHPFQPSALASFILENVYVTSINICAVMDIDIQNDDVTVGGINGVGEPIIWCVGVFANQGITKLASVYRYPYYSDCLF